MKGLVIGSTRRLSTLPDLPTGAEAGIPDFEAQGWNGLFAPKGTPPEVIAKLNVAARKAVAGDVIQKRFRAICRRWPRTRPSRRRRCCSTW